MTESEKFEKSFERPNNFFELDERVQWDIDKALGILDWWGGGAYGDKLTPEELERFQAHYDFFKKKNAPVA